MDLSHSNSGDHSNNFEFAFNSSNFSDRVLRIEIVAGAADSKSDGEGCSSIADWARHRKRRREDIKKEKAAEFDVYNSENIVSCDQPDTEDAIAFESHEEEAVAMIESPTDDEPLQSDCSWSMDCAPVLRVNSIFISSAILAAKSPFFYKLFSNGMRESDQRHATLRISASEEAALMELLSFMYSGKLSTSSAPLVLDVLMAADKFEVASCMRHCSQTLREIHMTTDSALLYLELPSSVSMASAVQPLTDVARDFLANKYRDITKFQDEVMNLPLAGIEAILSSDDLQVASEDAVYDFVLKWARAQYPKLEERKEILGSHLGRLIRFPHMTCRKLRKVLACSDLGHEISSKAVLEALFFKAETPHRQRAIASEEQANTRRYIERAYKYRPVKVVEFEQPHPQCIVYLDLKRDECANLFPGGRVYSQAFHLGGLGFFLSAHCNMDQQSSFHCFGLFLGMQEKGSVTFTVDYEFAARTRPAGDFVSKYKGYYTFTGGKAVGYRNLFAIPWTSFMADDSLYFNDGILHLSADEGTRSVERVIEQVTEREKNHAAADQNSQIGSQENKEKKLEINVKQIYEQTQQKVEAKKVQISTNDKQQSPHAMPDDRVRQLKDQLIRSRVYLGLGPLRSNPHFTRELRARMRDVQRALGDATKDSELSKSANEKLKLMEQTLEKGKRMQDDCSIVVKKLRAMLHSSEEQLKVHKKQTLFLNQLAAKTLPKGLHCLPLRLSTEYYSLDSSSQQFPHQEKLEDPSLNHYALFSDNILATSVVVNSTVTHAKNPAKQVFHIVTDRLTYAAMRMWFIANPPGEAAIQVQNIEEFTWLNESYSPVLKQLGSRSMIDYYFRTHRGNADANLKYRNPKYLSILNHLRFYLPEIFPKLSKVVFLDDDIVVQKDLTGLWEINMGGKVNGAVETCGESFHRFDRYLNFSNPLIAKNFDPHACGWAYGMNVFDLDEWRKQKITEIYHSWQHLNHDRLLWKLGSLPPGLITFWKRTFPLNRSWHVLGLGYDPNVSSKDIQRAAVIHYNGNMKPWLEIGMPKYRNYWSKHVDYNQAYLRECNITP